MGARVGPHEGAPDGTVLGGADGAVLGALGARDVVGAAEGRSVGGTNNERRPSALV